MAALYGNAMETTGRRRAKQKHSAERAKPGIAGFERQPVTDRSPCGDLQSRRSPS